MEQLYGAIPTVLRGLGTNDAVGEVVVFSAWKRCAGELLRQRTVPVDFFENRLIVAVADETWARHLEDLSPHMLVRLNAALGQGTVKFIEFRINGAAVYAAREVKVSSAIAENASIEFSPSLAAAAEAIADENLREQFLSAANSYLAKQNEPDLKSEIGK